MRKTLFLLIAFFFAFTSLADRKGNGGDGIRINGKVYLLDFVESGVEMNPFIDQQVQIDTKTLDRVTHALRALPDVPVRLLAKKLSELNRTDPTLSRLILKGIEFYFWRNVRVDLLPADLEDAPIHVPSDSLVRLATRMRQNIYVSREGWGQLNDKHKVGLIFHEILYSLMPFDRESRKCFKQSSLKARMLTGLLFTRDYDQLQIDRLDVLPWRLSEATNLIIKDKDKWVGVVKKGSFSGVGQHDYDDSSVTRIDVKSLSTDVKRFKGAVGRWQDVGRGPMLYPLGVEYKMDFIEGKNSRFCDREFYSGLSIMSQRTDEFQFGHTFRVINSFEFDRKSNSKRAFTTRNVKAKVKYLQQNPFRN